MSPRNNQASAIESQGKRFALNGPLVASLLALAVACLVVFSALATVVSAALGTNAGESQVAKDLSARVKANSERMKKYQEQFDGRSIFFKPSAWPAPPKAPVEDRGPEVPPPPPPPPPPPSVYTGPGILYAIGDVIRFKAKTANDEPLDIRVGEEKNGVKVVSVENLPWTVKVGYQGKEWDVPIFARGSDKFLVAQAKPIEVVPFLIEIPPKKPTIEVPRSSGEAVETEVAQPTAAQAAAAAAAAARENARGNARGSAERVDRARRSARPETPRQSPPPRPAPRAEDDEEDEAAEEEEAAADREVNEQEEEDEEVEEDDDAPASSNAPRGAPPADEDEDEEDEEEPAQQDPPRRGRPQPSPQGGQ